MPWRMAMRIFRVEDGQMKYWITTFQAAGIALFAGAIIAEPPKYNAVYWGVWLILVGAIFNGLMGGKNGRS